MYTPKWQIVSCHCPIALTPILAGRHTQFNYMYHIRPQHVWHHSTFTRPPPPIHPPPAHSATPHPIHQTPDATAGQPVMACCGAERKYVVSSYIRIFIANNPWSLYMKHAMMCFVCERAWSHCNKTPLFSELSWSAKAKSACRRTIFALGI